MMMVDLATFDRSTASVEITLNNETRRVPAMRYRDVVTAFGVYVRLDGADWPARIDRYPSGREVVLASNALGHLRAIECQSAVGFAKRTAQ